MATLRFSLSKRLIFAAALLLFAGCSRQQKEESGARVQPYSPAEGSIAFDIASASGSQNVHGWSAKYDDGGKVARFNIELERERKSKDYGMTFGKGRFVSQRDSDASIFLAKLKIALDAKTLPKKVTRVDSLPFEFVTLGENMSRSQDGGFSQRPRGDWMAFKIFLRGGEAEVYMNLNPVNGKAEFSIKDSDYGDDVLAELAKVL